MSRALAFVRSHGVDPRLFDLLLTAAIVVVGVGSQFAASESSDQLYRDTGVLAVLLGLGTTVPVYWRRSRPLPALLVSLACITALSLAEYRTNSLPLADLFLGYAVAAYAPRRAAWMGLVALNATIVLIYVGGTPGIDGQETLFNMALYSGAWLAGQVVRARSQTVEARLAEAEERAEAQRQQSARSVAEERLRLAQELHDVVAHSMSVIAVQAGMGVHVIDAQPQRAKEALESISATSRTTLTEMRRLLGTLRDEDGAPADAPAPAIADLGQLVAQVQAAGLPVDLEIEGSADAVPQSLQLSVYRIVQESLTNVLKHAGPCSATVSVQCRPDAVTVEVTDDGRGVTASNGHGGHGLVGMNERVDLWGGTLSARPRAGGGFRVTASLPLETVA